MKKAVLMTAGATAQKLMQDLAEEQEILMYLSDMIADTYIAESVILRSEKLVSQRGQEAASEQIDMMGVFVADAVERLGLNGRNAIKAWAEGDERRMLLMGLKRYTKFDGVNTKNARRRIAKKLLAANKYCF